MGSEGTNIDKWMEARNNGTAWRNRCTLQEHRLILWLARHGWKYSEGPGYSVLAKGNLRLDLCHGPKPRIAVGMGLPPSKSASISLKEWRKIYKLAKIKNDLWKDYKFWELCSGEADSNGDI